MDLSTEKSLKSCISDILSDYSGNLKGDLNSSLSLRDDLNIDSLTFVSIVIRLEDAFQVDLVEKGFELHTIRTIGDLLELGRSLQVLKSSAVTSNLDSTKESA